MATMNGRIKKWPVKSVLTENLKGTLTTTGVQTRRESKCFDPVLAK